MIHGSASIVATQSLTPRLHWLSVAMAGAAPAPGQFVMARCGPTHSQDPVLRRRCWVAGVNPDGSVLLLIATHDAPGRWLAAQPIGAALDLLGPLGRPLDQDHRGQTVLLIAEGAAVGSLLFQAYRAALSGAAVLLLAGGRPEWRLPPYVLPPEVEYLYAPGDPLALLDTSGPDRLAAPMLWAERIIGAGSSALGLRLAQRIRSERFSWGPGLAQFIVDVEMTCGVGACGGCWQATKGGAALLCHQGPALSLRQIL